MISTRTLIFAPRTQGNYCAALRNAALSACLAGSLALCGGFMEVVVAQIETGTIVGTVTDASEAVLPGVKVEIRSVSTGLTVTVTTNEAGRYQSPSLKPDNYEISATIQDFKTSRASLRLEVNQRVGLDFKLEPGAVTDAVTVTGLTPLLETENSTLGNVRSAKAVADLLLGAPISGNISIIEGTRGFRRHELGFYAHDDWKATPRLTLNVGLRYELYPSYPWVEVADRGAFLDFQTLTVSQLGTGNISRTGVKIDKNNFAPRIGLAYKLTDKTVIRSAYGIFYAAPQYEISRGPAVNPPFAGAFSFNNNQLNFTGARKIDQGFERTFSAADATLFAIDPNLRMPYVQQWNLNIQQQLPGDMTLTTAYVGTKGVKLRDQININQPRPGPGAVAPRRPFPQFNNIELTAFRANSIYHGLQATLDKRFTGGLSFLVSYTYSHAIDDADVFGGGHQDVMNLRADMRAEIFNLTNTPQFNNPNASIGSSQAGVISSAGSTPSFQRTSRQIQIAAKLLF